MTEKRISPLTWLQGKFASLVHTHTTSDITDLSIPTASSSTPSADVSGGAIGSSSNYAKADHQHPLSNSYARSGHNHDSVYINKEIIRTFNASSSAMTNFQMGKTWRIEFDVNFGVTNSWYVDIGSDSDYLISLEYDYSVNPNKVYLNWEESGDSWETTINDNTAEYHIIFYMDIGEYDTINNKRDFTFYLTIGENSKYYGATRYDFGTYTYADGLLNDFVLVQIFDEANGSGITNFTYTSDTIEDLYYKINTKENHTHNHGNLSFNGTIGSNANYIVITGAGGAITSTQKLGNITYDGKIGSTSGKPVITTTSGTVTTGSFGSTSGTFAEGNHTHSNYLTEHQSLTNYVQKSSTSGLIKNDGTIMSGGTGSSNYAIGNHTHSSYVNPTIADNLTTDSSTQVLSAKQGKVLNDLIGQAITYINQ